MADDEFLAAFEACAIPKADWTHEAHVRMAWLYLTRLPFEEARERVCAGIQRYNASLGGTGYHDTITVACVRLIAARMRGGEPYPAFRDRCPELFDRTLAVLRRHYTAERLRSPAAKEAFIESDLDALPEVRTINARRAGT